MKTLCNRCGKWLPLRDYDQDEVNWSRHWEGTQCSLTYAARQCTLTVSTDSVCPLLYISMSYGAATGPKSTCRNVPVSCPHCPKWLWSYGYLAHIESQHGENMVDALIEEHAISTTEFEAVLKPEVDGRTARATKKRKEESMLDKLKAELAAMRADKQPISKFWSKIMAPS